MSSTSSSSLPNLGYRFLSRCRSVSWPAKLAASASRNSPSDSQPSSKTAFLIATRESGDGRQASGVVIVVHVARAAVVRVPSSRHAVVNQGRLEAERPVGQVVLGVEASLQVYRPRHFVTDLRLHRPHEVGERSQILHVARPRTRVALVDRIRWAVIPKLVLETGRPGRIRITAIVEGQLQALDETVLVLAKLGLPARQVRIAAAVVHVPASVREREAEIHQRRDHHVVVIDPDAGPPAHGVADALPEYAVDAGVVADGQVRLLDP